MTLGAKISLQRNKLAMTQEELAEKLSLPLKDITNWERNITDPNKSQTEALAELFQLDPKELRSDDDGQPIFKDHPEDVVPINKKLCMKYCGIFALVGLLSFVSIFIVGFAMLTPALMSVAVSIYFFWKGHPLMPVYKKIFFTGVGIFLLIMLIQALVLLLVMFVFPL